MTDKLEGLRKALDPRFWPKYDIIFEGELYRWISDDPEEECMEKVRLDEGRFQ